MPVQFPEHGLQTATCSALLNSRCVGIKWHKRFTVLDQIRAGNILFHFPFQILSTV